MSNKRKILFIAWDSPHVTYLEGLFVPIFERLVRDYDFEFHIIQFSWASPARQSFLFNYCLDRGIHYRHVSIALKPAAFIGKFLTLYKGIWIIARYLRQHQIRIVMPRSTMPAKMVNFIKKSDRSLKVVFDADGLPIEERVDFAGLKQNSLRYRNLKGIEREVINMADVVLIRTDKAKQFLLDQYEVSASKFFVVINGRDAGFFGPLDVNGRMEARIELGISADATVCVYCGSLGPQYGIEQMLHIHRNLNQGNDRFVLLVLGNSLDYFMDKISDTDRNIITRRVPFEAIPKYLACADVAFAIRKSSFSMRGVAPIKIGEYLLTGLPVVASCGIGDTESQLSGKQFTFLLKNYDPDNLNAATEWIKKIAKEKTDSQGIRSWGISNFSLEASVQSYLNALNVLVK